MNNSESLFIENVGSTNEIEKLDIYLSDFYSVSRRERVSIYYNLLNYKTNILNVCDKFNLYLYGFDIKIRNIPKIIKNEKVISDYRTDVCFFYTEYRIVFLLDITQSLLSYDFSKKCLNLEKIEIYLESILNQLVNVKKTIKNSYFKDIIYTPKIIASFITIGNIEESIEVEIL